MSENKTTPKVFVCHASEDKARFAEPLARALVVAGIPTWLDAWDLGLGDGLLQQISEGIGSATFFVFVATPKSLSKPWVKAELEGGFAKRIRGEARFVTLVLDGCANQLPELLKGMRYMEVHDATAIDSLVQELLPTFCGVTSKPPLGPAPQIAALTDPPPGMDLTNADWRVMQGLCDSTREDVGGFVQGEALRRLMAEVGFTERHFCESLEALQEGGFVTLHRAMGPGMMGRGISHARITTSGFEQYLLATLADYPTIKRRVMVEIVNRDRCSSADLLSAVAASPRIVIHVAEWIEQEELAHVSFYMGPGRPFDVDRPSVRLRRMIDE